MTKKTEKSAFFEGSINNKKGNKRKLLLQEALYITLNDNATLFIKNLGNSNR